MAARAEITARYARAYRAASKKDKGRLLDGLERHGELVPGKARYSGEVRSKLEATSPATDLPLPGPRPRP